MSPANWADTALSLLNSQNTRGAASAIRQGLAAFPGDPLITEAAAAVLMLTGDWTNALLTWNAILIDHPGNSLALYGAGICSIAKGDRNRAQNLIELAAKNGDVAGCEIALRYLEMIGGAFGAGRGLNLPDDYRSSAAGLNGISAVETGNSANALTDLQRAMDTLTGDPLYEYHGLVMTFDAKRPVKTGCRALPAGNDLLQARVTRKQQAISGTVMLNPEIEHLDGGYVVYKIDGSVASIANSSPAKLAWNSAAVANGTHKIEIIIYDRQGTIVSRAEREIKTANENAPGRNVVESAHSERIRADLWRLLALRPSRCALMFAAYKSATARGDGQLAERYLSRTVAIDPDYRDAGKRLSIRWKQETGLPFWRGDPQEKLIALTFDDGPKEGITEALMKVLTSEKVLSTFFVIGRHASANPQLIKLMAEAGMEIENHSYTHPNLTMLTKSGIESELVKTVETVQSITGSRMKFYRPPGGNVNAEVHSAAAKFGLTACMWTVDADSLENGSPIRLAEFVLQRASPGAIVLLHNGRMGTVEALPTIISGLRSRGYSFVTVNELYKRRSLAVKLTDGTVMKRTAISSGIK